MAGRQVGVLAALVCVGLSQYGGGGGGHSSVPAPVAPLPVVNSPTCWTESETVWDTQYQDMAVMECKPVTQQVCSQVNKVRREKRDI